MKDSSSPPDKPEAIQAGMKIEEYAKAEWKKVITGGLGTVGFGQKGFWNLLIGLLGWI
jgi:hypothetical protein